MQTLNTESIHDGASKLVLRKAKGARFNCREMPLTVLLVDESSKGLSVLSGQEGFHPASEDISHHKGPLKSHPFVAGVTLQGGCCMRANRFGHIPYSFLKA